MSHPDSTDRNGNSRIRQIEGLFYSDKTPVTVHIEDGKITDIQKKEVCGKLPSGSLFIAPGLIDIQVNGYLGNNFTGEELTVEQVRKVVQALWKVGVTGFLPTIITSSLERMVENFSVLAEALEDPGIHSSIPGFHLEGPYISAVDGYRGAHNKIWVRPPDWDEFQKIYRASGKNIFILSLAPELPGAIDFIRKCKQYVPVVALAHHNASPAIVKQAVKAGATLSTHLGNGMANLIHRDNNPFWSQLAEEQLFISIITDGFHLPREQVITFYKVKGPDKIILISDMTDLAGLPAGEYFWDGKNIVLEPEGVIRYPEQKVLAGAATPLLHDVENIISMVGCSLGDAIDMASRNPAKLLGLDDRGKIEIGKRGDLILFSLEEGKIDIEETIVNGQTVFKKTS